MQGKAILVVDDEPALAGALRDILTLDGHAVETATDGVVALEKLRERPYDVILSDWVPTVSKPFTIGDIRRVLQQVLRGIGD